MIHSKESIINKAFELNKYCIPIINKWPRDYKFTLGDRLQNILIDLMQMLIEAYYSPPEKKKELLTQVNIQLEQTRYLFRLGYELNLYHSRKFQDFAQRIDEIGRMNGGWLKSLENKKIDPPAAEKG